MSGETLLPGRLRIAQISTADIAGGAERVAFDLFTEYRKRGHVSRLAVGRKRSTDPDVVEIQSEKAPDLTSRLLWSLHANLTPFKHTSLGGQARFLLSFYAHDWTWRERQLGWESFHHPGSRQLLALLPEKPDLLHAHNLHGNYFDLRRLPNLSRKLPVFVTMHDSWLLSGHCAHSIECDRWKIGCGSCPDLTLFPAISRDATAFNFRRKRRIYEQSRLYVSAPSRWLLNKLPASMLSVAAVESRVVPNGIDLGVWKPGDRDVARSELNLSRESVVIMAAGNHLRTSSNKDYATLSQALHLAIKRCEQIPIVCLLFGDDSPEKKIGISVIRSLPFERDRHVVARYYRAADIFVHAAKADTFPNAVLEAMACGTPVVATAVGGIPEQIEDGITGFLTKPRDPTSMADRLEHLIRHTSFKEQMGKHAAASTPARFGLAKTVDAYLSWYYDVLDRAKSRFPKSS